MKLRAAVIDVETTGLDPQNDEVVELGVVLFSFDALSHTGIEIEEEYSSLRDPGRPIPEGATRAHGLRWDDVRGCALDDARVRGLLERASFLVAHNAPFDRGFMERLYPETHRMKWLCSMEGVAWKAKGFRSRALQQLLRAHQIGEGAAHRALDDARNTLRLLSLPQPDGRTYLAELLSGR
jgi:DNA polymerase-3 subunit epsilon